MNLTTLPYADSTMDQPQSRATVADQSRPPAANRPQFCFLRWAGPSPGLQWRATLASVSSGGPDPGVPSSSGAAPVPASSGRPAQAPAFSGRPAQALVSSGRPAQASSGGPAPVESCWTFFLSPYRDQSQSLLISMPCHNRSSLILTLCAFLYVSTYGVLVLQTLDTPIGIGLTLTI